MRARTRALVALATVVVLLAGALAVRARSAAPPAPLPAPASNAALAAQPDAWPVPVGDAAARRVTPAAAALDRPVAWRLPLDAAAVAPLVAGAGALFVALDDGTLRALALASGRERWRVDVPGWLDGAPAVSPSAVLVPLRDGTLRALDPASGAERWRWTGPRSISAAPVVVDGVAYVATNGAVVALDAATGAERWRASLGDAFVVAPPAVDGTLLAVATSDRVRFFDREAGALRFHWPLTAAQGRAEAVALGESMAVIATQGVAAAIDRAARRPWWSPLRPAWRWLHVLGAAPEPPWSPYLWETDHRGGYAPAISGRAVVLATRAGTVRAHDARAGAVLWERRGAGVTAAPLVAAEGVLVARGTTLELLDVASGEQRARRALDAAPAPVTEVVVVTGGAVLRLGDREIWLLR